MLESQWSRLSPQVRASLARAVALVAAAGLPVLIGLLLDLSLATSGSTSAFLVLAVRVLEGYRDQKRNEDADVREGDVGYAYATSHTSVDDNLLDYLNGRIAGTTAPYTGHDRAEVLTDPETGDLYLPGASVPSGIETDYADPWSGTAEGDQYSSLDEDLVRAEGEGMIDRKVD